MLAAEFERAGERLDVSTISVIDAFKIFVTRVPRNLSGALRFYCGLEHATAHEALGDVQATRQVLEAQLNRYPDLPSDPRAIDTAVRDPEEVDRRGKLKWMDAEVSLSFGRHKGKSLRFLAREEPDYIRWMIDNRVVDDAVHHLHDALIGHFAKKDKQAAPDQAGHNSQGDQDEK